MAALRIPWHVWSMVDASPDAARLRDAALAHLARYATTGAGLTRVLDRRVDRWARAVQAEPEQVKAAKAVVRGVVAKLAEIGAVDDAAYAEMRARSLSRAGRSRRAIAAHLAQRGVAAETAAGVLPDDAEAELAAALAWSMRRRIGPFRRSPVDQAGQLRELGVLARAGFAQPVARAALAMPPDEAAARISALRRA
jgi:regulatory protein